MGARAFLLRFGKNTGGRRFRAIGSGGNGDGLARGMTRAAGDTA